MEKRYLTPREFAQFSGMSEKSVRRRLKAGQLPAIQSGGPNTLWQIDAEAYAQAACQGAHGSGVRSGLLNANAEIECEKKFPGPRPKWTRPISTPNYENYGPKEKEKQ